MSRDRPSVHIDPLMIEAYAAQLVDAGSAVTIEQHLTRCEHCRACVAAAGIRGELPGLSPGRLEGIWTVVVEAIDAPPASVPHRMRHYLWLAGNRVQHLLSDFEIPKMRMIPWARRAIVTVIAAITISTLVYQGTLVFSADRRPADLPTGRYEFCPLEATKLPGFGPGPAVVCHVSGVTP